MEETLHGRNRRRLHSYCATGSITSLSPSLSTMFRTVVFITLLCTPIVVIEGKTDLRMGLLLPEYRPGMRFWPYFKQMVQPGIDIALKKAEEILPDHNVTYLWQNTQCSNPVSMVLSVHMKYDFKCDVFFGPACEYAVAPVARFCDYWETPLITAGALAQGFNKNVFQTITRMQGSYDKFGNSVVDLFQRNNWNITMLLVDEPIGGEIRDCFFCMGGVSWTLKENAIYHEVETFDEKTITRDGIVKILHEVRDAARSK